MMKKVCLLALAVMMAFPGVRAQDESVDEPKNEIGVMYGVGSASNVISVFGAVFTFSAGKQTNFWGPVGVEYYHHVSRVVSLGAVATYAGCKWDRPFKQEVTLNSRYISVMPSVKFNWLRKKRFGMYSAVSAGVMLASIGNTDRVKKEGEGSTSDSSKARDETECAFMFQATAVGAEVGGACRGFLELGVGEKGIVCAGLRYRF